MQQIIKQLRNDARKSIAAISRETNTPVSTVYDRIKKLEKCIIKHTSLIDFSKLNHHVHIHLYLKGKEPGKLFEFLNSSKCLNNLRRVEGYDFLAECIFPDMRGMHDFYEELDGYIESKKEIHIIEPLKQEAFLG